MLEKFEVKNFKNFDDNFVFDLSEIKNYEFNSECINDDTVAKALIYGPNGCGKTNLGRAIFDIKNHLTDEKISSFYSTNYLNAESDSELAEFVFTFKFGDSILEYSYGKESANKIIYEVLKIDDIEVISLDRRNNNIISVELEGAETLNRDLGDNDLSAVKYVKNNTALEFNITNQVLKTFFSFIEDMWLIETVDLMSKHIDLQSFITLIEKYDDVIEKLELFLNKAEITCKLTIVEMDGEKRLFFDYGNKKIDFFKNASSGTISLAYLFFNLMVLEKTLEFIDSLKEYHKIIEKKQNPRTSVLSQPFLPFIFIDEFDAFYHYSVSRAIVENLKGINCQALLTTHNTSIMTNDLLRPDCYFIMSNTDIKPVYSFTDKELRKAHNIEKMYRAGVFDE